MSREPEGNDEVALRGEQDPEIREGTPESVLIRTTCVTQTLLK